MTQEGNYSSPHRQSGGQRSLLVLSAISILILIVLALVEPRLIWFALIGSLALLGLTFFLWLRDARQDRSGPLPDIKDEGAGALLAEDLARAVSDPLIIFDRTGSVIFANPASETSFGPIPPGTPLQLRFRAPELRNLIDNALKDGFAQALSLEYAERLPIERVFHVSLTRFDARERLAVLIFQDQSEMRRIDRMRADFIANASHELRTPLATISGFVETLRGPARDDPAARDRFLGIMLEQTKRMARLIDELLSLSRIESKAMLAPGEKADLTQVLKSVVDANLLRAKESNMEILLTLPNRPMEVAGSKDELFQVFENLIENALKYGRSERPIEVTLETRKEGNEVGPSISVRDHGAGIEADQIPRITERFYRVEAAAGKQSKGVGLGLAIVKHILNRHHARLIIQSVPGEGSEFRVFFAQSGDVA